jgi:pimeloyl-ACP methyl ester carboxylesterase
MEALFGIAVVALLYIAHCVHTGYRRRTHPYEMIYDESGLTAGRYDERQFVSLEEALDFTATLVKQRYAFIHVTDRSAKDRAGYSAELVRDEKFNPKHYKCSVHGSITLTSAQLAARITRSDAGVNDTSRTFGSETWDKENLAATKRLAIVAVHGTFARGAVWTSDNSILANAIRAELSEHEVSWHAFDWSGGNSHVAREDAATKLATFLVALSSRQAGPIFLVCHSHGGNVALMALLHRPELDKVIAGVVCLSTPFFQAVAKDFGDFMQLAYDTLNLKGIAFSAFIYFGSISYLSHKWPELFAPATTIYVVMLLMAMATSVALRGKLRKQDQVEVLRKYRYSEIRLPVLAIRATYDEAFHWIRTSSLAADSLIIAAFLIGGVALIGAFLTLGFLWPFAIPVVMLFPLVLITGNGLRALIRAAPLTVGEGPVTSFLASFATSSKLTIPTARNVSVSLSFDDAHRKLKLRHSALYDAPRVAVIVSRFVKGESLEEYIGGNSKA